MFFKLRKKVWFKNLVIMSVWVFIFAQLSMGVHGSTSDAHSRETGTSINHENDIEATVKASDDARTVITFDIKNFSIEPVMIDQESYYKIKCEDTRLMDEAGFPELPRLCSNIIIPNDSDVQLNIVEAVYTDYTLTPIVPSKGTITRDVNPETVPYEFNDIYNSTEWYPQNLAQLSEPFIMRDVRGATVYVHAFQYQPSTQTLRVYDTVTVEVVKTHSASKNVLNATKSQVNKEFDSMYDYLFLNYQSMPTKAPGNEKMLVITNDAYRTAMEPFVNWKNQKGIDTEMVNISQVSSRNSSTEIKNYIKNYYNQNNDLVYVLLVGDYAHISSPSYGYGVSDPEYTKIVGNDNYPDIFVGRFSAESVADVETQVERTLDFEKNGYNKMSWFKKGIGIASNEGPGHNNEYDYQHIDNIRSKLLGAGYTAIDRVYDPGARASTVTNGLNAGRGIINYCGHGSTTSFSTTGFNVYDIRNLDNDNMLPFIISVACVNGKFFDRTCFAEVWLRSTDNQGEPIGAIGTYMSTVNQPWVPPMTGQDAINDLIVNKTIGTFGGLCYLGGSKMLDNGGYSDILTFNTWTVFGDPSIQLFD
ncbi:hypothetical protein HZI73_06705 [Vallitalea pronyensis]|uniref:Gingipain R n=1 Tax=Vallitalea pronyensis TaxID=1348613 RepID=A0A8J8MI07_9FIRM|nr:C25 family cysteine peptidase [Vallitalea pronyensis]QUI22010.1 hypothetical protein HZI73_06705 [Vallitalea pronyensis]